MSLLKLDHLAISCETLGAGTQWAETCFGQPFAAGGQHRAMGTHNRLLGLGQEYYLEVIAIDPDAEGPPYPRWFNLDNFNGSARLSNWICATDDLDAALKLLGPGYGTPMSLQRGALKWRMAVPETGVLPFDGWAPALIEWEGHDHPAQLLPKSDVTLELLRLHHPKAQEMAEQLAPHLPRDTIVFQQDETPKLSALFSRAGDDVWLE